MNKVKILIFSGYGLNCEEETKFAFELAGGEADIVHINDLVEDKSRLSKYQIIVFPGGFSYGDDTGSGKAYANKAKNHLSIELKKFVEKENLVLGICNGFQILTNLGLLPGALTFNDSARYTDRWVDIKFEGVSPWTEDIDQMMIPIAHGEGKYFTEDQTLKKLNKEKRIAYRYYKGEACSYQNLPANPNGAIEDIAAVLAYDGRVMGTMPHPERAMFFHQLPNWPLIKEKLMREGKPIPQYGPGLKIFQNAIKFFD